MLHYTSARPFKIKIRKQFSYYKQLCLLLFLLAHYYASSQNKVVDSLLAVVENKNANAETYNQLAQEYWFIDMKQSKVFAFAALNLALETNDSAQEGYAYNRLGTACLYLDKVDSAQLYYNQSAAVFEELEMYTAFAGATACCAKIFENKHDYTSAIKEYEKALEIFKNQAVSEYYVQTLVVVGNLYSKLGNYQNAEKYLYKALENKSYLKLNDQILIYNYLGVNYQNLGDFEKAIHYFEEAFKHCDLSEDNIAIATTYINTGRLYTAWGKYQAALEYLQKGFDLAKTAGIERFCRTILPLVGEIYLKLEEYEKAEEYYSQFFNSIADSDDDLDQAKAYQGLAQIATVQNQHDRAIEHSLKALALFDKVQRPFYQANVHCLLAENYLSKSNYTGVLEHLNAASELAVANSYKELSAQITLLRARYYAGSGRNGEGNTLYESYIAQKDSLFARKNQELLAQYQIELDNLEKENELKEAERQNKLHQLKIVQKKKQVVFISILSLLLLFGAIVFATMYVRKQKANRLLFLKNKELLEKEDKLPQKKEGIEISEALQHEIIQKLNASFKEQKIHLRNDLTLHTLAKELGTNSSYLSKIIQSNYQYNFSTYLNRSRIDEAQKIILDQKFSHYTIDAISQECGYNSKSTFNKAFKDITGLTPNEYKRQQQI